MKSGFVYFIGSETGETIKIGFSVSPEKRIRQVQSGNPEPLKLLHQFRADKRMEAWLHDVFASCRLKGEWFRNADALRAIAARIEEKHLAGTLAAMGLASMPDDTEGRRAVVQRFDARPLSRLTVKRAALEIIPA